MAVRMPTYLPPTREDGSAYDGDEGDGGDGDAEMAEVAVGRPQIRAAPVAGALEKARYGSYGAAGAAVRADSYLLDDPQYARFVNARTTLAAVIGAVLGAMLVIGVMRVSIDDRRAPPPLVGTGPGPGHGGSLGPGHRFHRTPAPSAAPSMFVATSPSFVEMTTTTSAAAAGVRPRDRLDTDADTANTETKGGQKHDRLRLTSLKQLKQRKQRDREEEWV